MNYQHKILAADRWKTMSLCEQMANIGSDIDRALKWQQKEKPDYCHKAVERALELLHLTIDTTSSKSHIKELTRLREAIIDYFYDSNQFGSSEALWKKYFNHFNYKARITSNYF